MEAPNPDSMGDGGHLREHMREASDYLGSTGRWLYLATVVLSILILATMFLAYAELWPLG
jgi:hypothetical protein